MFINELGEPMDTLNNLALSISQIHKWNSNERKLVDVENPKVWKKNEKHNKTFEQNNKQES
jgi:hypothetical protein